MRCQSAIVTCIFHVLLIIQVKNEAISVTGRVSLSCFDTSKLPHFLVNRVTVGGEIDGLIHRWPTAPRMIPDISEE
jgi:hypothetical protein